MTPLAHPLFESATARPALETEAGIVLSVIVPVTERPYPLAWLYEEYAPALKSRGEAFEFLFVVDRWAREFARSLEPLIESGEPIRVFEVGHSVGESGMLEGVLSHARGGVLLTLPAYPRVHGEGLLELWSRVESDEVDVATARRVSARGSRLGKIQRRVFHALLRGGSGAAFEDVASGVRAMRREVLEEVPVYGDLFRFLPILAQREGFRVEEIPLPQHPEDAAARVYSPGVYARRLIDLLGLFFLVRFTRKPLRFFGLVGAALSGLGLLCLLDLVIDRFQGSPVADRPLLLLGVLLLVTGIQAIAMGLIGEIIVHLNAGGGRREYRVRSDST